MIFLLVPQWVLREQGDVKETLSKRHVNTQLMSEI